MLGFGTSYLYAKFDDSSLNRSSDVIDGPQIYGASRDPDHAPSEGHLSSECWDLILPTHVYKI